MENPRLGLKSELQLPVYAIATATLDSGGLRSLSHISMQCRIFNPPRKAEIKLTSSWILVRFITAEAQWKLLLNVFCKARLMMKKSFSLFLTKHFISFSNLHKNLAKNRIFLTVGFFLLTLLLFS